MFSSLSDSKLFYFFWTILGLAYLALALFTDGTGEAGGDSVTHYLYAHEAFHNPIIYFNHWAKPFFTLLASPFAYFGFKGMRLFNVMLTLGSVWFLYDFASLRNLKNAWLLSVFYLASPHAFRSALSGLTEPLSAFMLIFSIWLIQKNKSLTAALIIGMLPFVRSEGLILMAVFALYFLYQKKWKACLALSFGHIIWSIAGWKYYNDILWVFTKIPYANLGSPYGHGNWMHFPEQLYFFMGPVMYVGLCVGLIYFTFTWLKNKFEFSPEFFLIYLLFIAFFSAHAIFWVYGIFNSMGLIRVFITVMPCMMWLSVYGWNTMMSFISNKMVVKTISLLAALFCIVIQFTHNPSAIRPQACIYPSEQQRIIKEDIVPFIRQLKNQGKLYSSEANVALYNSSDYINNKGFFNNLKYGLQVAKNRDLFFWDSWFGPTEEGISKNDMSKKYGLKLLKSFPCMMENGDSMDMALFVK